MPLKVGVFGASGYTGAELLRLAAGHPDLDVVLATADSQAGTRAAGLDLAFLALPHGASQHLVPDLRKRVGKIVDLAADFRLHDPSLYPTWYGEEHIAPDLLSEFAFGIPELFREQLRDAPLVAAAGCY